MRKFQFLYVLLVGIALGFGAAEAQARAGYASWVKHGDIYVVDGKFGKFQQKFNVSVAWKGNGFIVNTPLGSYRLKRRGKSVTFKVYFQQAWAHVTWSRTRAYVNYKGVRGQAVVKKVGSRGSASKRKVKTNFNKKN
ncbi:MAG: hypothetical protein AAF441_14655 [Pseudomonadota bacterium]